MRQDFCPAACGVYLSSAKNANLTGKCSIELDTYLAGIDETHAYYSAYTQSASPFAVVFMKDMTIVPGESSGQKYLWLIILIAAVLIAGIITGVCIRQHRKKTAGFSEIKEE